MESIAKEVKSFRRHNGTIISTLSSKNMTKGSTTIKQEQSTKSNDFSIVETESMDTNDQSSSKRAKEKGPIMEHDIDGLEYSSEEESTKPNEYLNHIFGVHGKKSKADMVITNCT